MAVDIKSVPMYNASETFDVLSWQLVVSWTCDLARHVHRRYSNHEWFSVFQGWLKVPVHGMLPTT